MNDFDKNLLKEMMKNDGAGEKEKDPYQKEKDNILEWQQEFPTDLQYFKMEELKPEDFELIRRFKAGPAGHLTDTELLARQNDLDLDNPLNTSQKELNSVLIHLVIREFQRRL